MKKLFIVLCDIMAVAAIIAAIFLVWWAVAAALGWEADGTMRSICIGSAVVLVIATVASFVVWRNGGAPGGDDPQGKAEANIPVNDVALVIKLHRHIANELERADPTAAAYAKAMEPIELPPIEYQTTKKKEDTQK